MKIWGLLFCALSLCVYSSLCASDCLDLRGRLVSHGLHYVPGPDTCNLCVCDNGQAKFCKAVIFSPPQDCRSFRVGNSCYEFICLDDGAKPSAEAGNDMNLRLIAAGAIAAILALTAVLIYKVVFAKRNSANTDDQRSLNSIGYISGGMAYIGGTCETGLSSWKPPTNYLPRGEAPPPYDEAVAQSRAEALRLVSESGYSRPFPAPLDAVGRSEDPVRYTGHTYENVVPQISQVANPSFCYNAPLLQSLPSGEGNVSPNFMARRLMNAHSGMGGGRMVRLTGSLGAISGRALSVLPDPERPHNVPGFYPTTDVQLLQTSLHRTIPRISTAIDTTILDTSLSNFNRSDRILQNEIRRSFHKPNENIRRTFADTGRSMPRNLNLVSNLESNRIDSVVIDSSVVPAIDNRAGIEVAGPSEVLSTSKVTSAAVVQETASSLPLNVDKPSCVCSYDNSPSHEPETDDYRSECANCKSATSSKWVVEEGWVEEEEGGTQTLQRRAPPFAAPTPAPATATLPQPVTKQRPLLGPTSSNWENWFHAIPDSDSESEDE